MAPERHRPSGSDELDSVLRRYHEAIHDGGKGDAEIAFHELAALLNERQQSGAAAQPDSFEDAALREEAGDWNDAERIYRALLRPTIAIPALECRVHSCLSTMCLFLHREGEALHHAEAALLAAGRASLATGHLAMLLLHKAQILIKMRRTEEAHLVIDQLFCAVGEQSLYEQSRSRATVLRAECYLHHGRLSDAKGALASVFSVLDRMSRTPFAAGALLDLAEWWSVTAKLRAMGEGEDASLPAWHQTVETLRAMLSMPHAHGVYNELTLAERLSAYGAALMACGHGDSAQDAIAQAQAIFCRYHCQW